MEMVRIKFRRKKKFAEIIIECLPSTWSWEMWTKITNFYFGSKYFTAVYAIGGRFTAMGHLQRKNLISQWHTLQWQSCSFVRVELPSR